ncbi:telomere repeat-binding factor 1-like [Vicia villosa]|uniref:telomere repeat-binding factor 1-like n=1 Tax=Vicia villosa TaxID=3911 RepID=UPI00273B7E3F|nr:telomere repeat-binding factor 1-like [Vicia villosa]XP_058762157.1 telomere repeat-binding factor 1-like [Vicia villosa]
MGAPKQKWTSEEESALKAGVVKHGVGKWRTILKDPEFNCVLFLRSNVDLKDKWRNLSVMANGWTSREKSKVAIKRVHHHGSRHDENSLAVIPASPSDDDIVDVKPLQVSRDMLQIPGPKRSIERFRLDNLIMEAISSLNELGGSNKTTIASFILDHYYPPADFKNLLSAKLKYLASSGKLIKVKRRYRIAPTHSDRGRHQPMLLLEGRQKGSMKFEIDDSNMPSQSEIDYELEKLRSMSAEEAAAVAARAVAEAEAAIAEAEEATKEAEAAEADADVAQAFADAAMKSVKVKKSTPKTTIPA